MRDQKSIIEENKEYRKYIDQHVPRRHQPSRTVSNQQFVPVNTFHAQSLEMGHLPFSHSMPPIQSSRYLPNSISSQKMGMHPPLAGHMLNSSQMGNTVGGLCEPIGALSSNRICQPNYYHSLRISNTFMYACLIDDD